MFFWVFIGFLIIQRLGELVIAKRNEKRMFARGAVEYDRSGYKYIVMMHTLFFLSLMSEYQFFSKELNPYWWILLPIFLITQVARYWAISSLGEYWNTRIIVLKGSPLIKKGPYKFLKHPNYIVVGIELAVIPLIFSCYFTAIFFTILNIILLNRRIRIESRAIGIDL
jgi:methyltransferase